MTDEKQFRILTPDGRLSHDTFVVPVEQPRKIKTGCLLVLHEGSGRRVTVHTTRLFPADAVSSLPFGRQLDVCPTCGRVEGVVEDQITCPYHGDSPCGLVESYGVCTLPAPGEKTVPRRGVTCTKIPCRFAVPQSPTSSQ